MRALLALAVLPVVAGCGSSESAATTVIVTTTTVPSTTTITSASTSTTTTLPPREPQFYVSLGDSYATGYQPAHDGTPGGNLTAGFDFRVARRAGERGFPLTLVNLACGGATTDSIIHTPGCLGFGGVVPGATTYDSTQAEAAEAFLRDHPGEVALITLSIGVNDFTPCLVEPDIVACVTETATDVARNIAELLTRLRAAAGPSVRIIGTTYPVVSLVNYLHGDTAAEQVAAQSVISFRSIINPTLRAAYETGGGTFVDVTEASGAYLPIDLTDMAPQGTIREAAAALRRFTFMCDKATFTPPTTAIN